MAPHALSYIALVSAAATVAVAQTTTSLLTWASPALVDKHFPKPSDAPEKVWPDEPAYERGIQTGYNICNSTTEGPNSQCQTSYFNDLSDFCLWAPPTPNTNISDSEGVEVAFCTKKGYGTRIMAEGTLLGAQLLRSKDYYMITGLIDQTKLNIHAGDTGGELDSGSQDGRGNPIGGLVYSTAFNTSIYQVNWWTEFIGSNQFCIKICNPSGSNEAGYCQHTLDRIGLGYNCPSKYTLGGSYPAGEFEICDTDDMTVPGIYTDAAGATQSYAQPPESDGEISTIPYSPTAAASRNCQTTASSALYTDLVAASPTGSGSTSPSGSGSGSGSGAAPTAKPTGTNSAAADKSGSASGSNPSSTSKSGAGHAAVVGTAFSIVVAGAAFIALI